MVYATDIIKQLI